MRRTANALAVEPDEAPVTSNELPEANVASIRADLANLKVDIRAVAAKAESELKTAVARIDEQFREVRQDIRELRADNKSLRDKVDANYVALDKKIDNRFDELRADIKAINASVEGLKGMQKAILWVLGGGGTFVAIVVGGLTIARTMNWI